MTVQKHKYIVLLLLIGLVLIGLGACRRGQAAAPEKATPSSTLTAETEGATLAGPKPPSAPLRFYLQDLGPQLNPFWRFDEAAQAVFHLVYRQLLQMDDQGRLQGDLIDQLQFSQDHQQILITLKKDRHFISNELITVEDIMTSFICYRDGLARSLKLEAGSLKHFSENDVESFQPATGPEQCQLPADEVTAADQVAILNRVYAYQTLSPDSFILYLDGADDRLLWNLRFPILPAKECHKDYPDPYAASGSYFFDYPAADGSRSLTARDPKRSLQKIQLHFAADEAAAIHDYEAGQLDLVLLSERFYNQRQKRAKQKSFSYSSMDYAFLQMGDGLLQKPEETVLLKRLWQNDRFRLDLGELYDHACFLPLLRNDPRWSAILQLQSAQTDDNDSLFREIKQFCKKQTQALRLLPRNNDDDEARVLADILRRYGFKVELLNPADNDYENAYISRDYDLALQHLQLAPPADPLAFWQALDPLKTLQLPELQPLQQRLAADRPAYYLYPAAAGRKVEDIARDLLALDLKMPLCGLGFTVHGMILSDHVDGSLSPTIQNILNGVEDLYVWPY